MQDMQLTSNSLKWLDSGYYPKTGKKNPWKVFSLFDWTCNYKFDWIPRDSCWTCLISQFWLESSYSEQNYSVSYTWTGQRPIIVICGQNELFFFIRGKNNQRKQQIQMFFLISLYPVLVVISDINWMVVVLFSISLNMTQYECDSETSKKSKLQLFQADFILNCILNTCLRRLYLILS